MTFALQDPVTEEDDWYYPMKKQLFKFIVSALTLTFMVCLVLASVLSVIIYRVITSVDYCPGISAQACVLLTTVVSSLLNTISILILGKVTKYTEVWFMVFNATFNNISVISWRKYTDYFLFMSIVVPFSYKAQATICLKYC